MIQPCQPGDNVFKITRVVVVAEAQEDYRGNFIQHGHSGILLAAVSKLTKIFHFAGGYGISKLTYNQRKIRVINEIILIAYKVKPHHQPVDSCLDQPDRINLKTVAGYAVLSKGSRSKPGK
jgi:hypothetical protein